MTMKTLSDAGLPSGIYHLADLRTPTAKLFDLGLRR
jgi:hypothetical protein